MKKKGRTILTVILMLIFTVSMSMLLYELFQYRAGEETYEEAEKLAGLAERPALSDSAPEEETPSSSAKSDWVDPYADDLAKMDFSALQAVNPEILGWILIPGTNVSYPLLQSGDNSYYLNHTWKKQQSIVGAIFLECQNSGDLSDFNTIVYGHNMKNGSMFGSLQQYKKAAYWKSHPSIYLTSGSGSRCYQVFAAYEVSTQGTAYQLGFSTDAAKQTFLDFCLDQSALSTGVTPTVNDQILTLSTCTGHGHATRWVVQGVLKNAASAQDAAGKESTAPASSQAPPADTSAVSSETAETAKPLETAENLETETGEGPVG